MPPQSPFQPSFPKQSKLLFYWLQEKARILNIRCLNCWLPGWGWDPLGKAIYSKQGKQCQQNTPCKNISCDPWPPTPRCPQAITVLYWLAQASHLIAWDSFFIAKTGALIPAWQGSLWGLRRQINLKYLGLGQIQGCFGFVFNLPVDSGQYPLMPCPLGWKGPCRQTGWDGLPALLLLIAVGLWSSFLPTLNLCFLFCMMSIIMEPTTEDYYED